MDKRELLEKIHLRQAEQMLAMLEDEDRELTAQEMNAVNKFLADNGMDLATGSKPVRRMTKLLTHRDPDLDRISG